MDEKLKFYKKHGNAILHDVLKNRSTSRLDQDVESPIIIQFGKNASIGIAEYKKAMKKKFYKTGMDGVNEPCLGKITHNYVKRIAYDKFWNFKKNIKYLADNPRKLSKKKPIFNMGSLVHYMKVKNLEIKQSMKNLPVEPWEIPSAGKSINYTLKEASDIIEKEWDVQIKHVWSITGWWYGYHKLTISEEYNPTDDLVSPPYYKHRGTMWVAKKFKDTDIDQSIPVNTTDTVLFAPYTEKLIHEMTHAVQNTFVPYWTRPREISEIATMLIERKYGPGFGKVMMSKQLSLAIADLTSKDAQDFDSIYKRESPFKNPGSITCRMPHYYRYPRSYFTYVLGMVIPIEIDRDLIRSTDAVVNLVNKHILPKYHPSCMYDTIHSK